MNTTKFITNMIEQIENVIGYMIWGVVTFVTLGSLIVLALAA